MNLNALLVSHKALEGAKSRCGHKGLEYTDTQMAIEEEILSAVERGEEHSLQYQEEREYLFWLRRQGIVPSKKRHPYRT